MSASFDFLALPSLVHSGILKKVGINDFLTFASLSRNSLSIAKCARLNLDTLGWTFAEDNRHRIEVGFDFLIEFNPTFNPDVPLEVVVLGDMKIRVHKTEYRWLVVEPNRPAAYLLDVMEQLTQLILSFSKAQRFELQTSRKQDVMNLFVWKHTRALHYFRLPTNRYSGPELEFVLQKIDVKTLDLPEEHEFRYSGPLTMDAVIMESGAWLTEDNLRNMKCREVHIVRDFPPAQINALIKLWLNGDLPNLEIFTVKQWYLDTSEIFKDIETMPWDPKNRPGRFMCIDLSHGEDIRRADGTLASCSTSRKFRFVVWHSKFL